MTRPGAVVLTEGSSTTDEGARAGTVRDYLQGSFASMRTVAEELEDQGFEVALIVHTPQGPINGSDPAKALPEENPNGEGKDASARTQQALLHAAPSARAIVVSLTQDTFDRVLPGIWDDLVTRVRADAVVCLAGASSSLARVDLTALERAVAEVHVYQRRGVARLDRQTRGAFLRATEELHSDKRGGVVDAGTT